MVVDAVVKELEAAVVVGFGLVGECGEENPFSVESAVAFDVPRW